MSWKQERTATRVLKPPNQPLAGGERELQCGDQAFRLRPRKVLPARSIGVEVVYAGGSTEYTRFDSTSKMISDSVHGLLFTS
jgi:hypothetical protein